MINGLYTWLWKSGYSAAYKQYRNNEIKKIVESRDKEKINLLWHEYYTSTQTIIKSPKTDDLIFTNDPNGYLKPMYIKDKLGNYIPRPEFKRNVTEAKYVSDEM